VSETTYHKTEQSLKVCQSQAPVSSEVKDFENYTSQTCFWR